MTTITESSIATVGLILLVASVVAMVSRRLRLPYSVGLVVAGIALAIFPLGVELPLTRDLIFSVLLPPLIFEAALQLRWRPFRHNLPITLTLAFLGVIVAAGCVAAGMHAFLGWTWIGAGLFGVLIAATDPVSVIAAFKEMRVEPRLSMIVESESLLNDGAAAVGFGLLVTFAASGATEPSDMIIALMWTALGGAVAGGIVGGAVLMLAGRTQDHLVEITLTTIAAYGSFMLAEHLHMSGVLASLTAGLVVGNVGWMGSISSSGRQYVIAFWEYAAFVANSIVFILIGGHEAHQPIALFTGATAIAVGMVMLGRVLVVYPLCGLFHKSSLKVDFRYQHILVWGGLRGALALALALALPVNIAERQDIIVVAFGVVAFSIFVQGLTMPWLIRRLALTESKSAQ